MSIRGYAARGVEVLLVVLLVALVAGSLLGQPVLLSFVETGSMEPTLEPGDGFVAIPSPIAGDVEEGDVVVFEAKHLQGGGLTTHRVVDETEEGYVTKGDANPFPDQDGQEPPVTEGQIVAEALQINGEVVVIPGLGTAVETVRGGVDSVQRTLAVTFGTRAFLGTNGLVLFSAIFGMLVLLYGLLWEGGRRERNRTWSRKREGVYDPGRLLLAFALFVTLLSAGTMVAMSETHEYGMVSASFESESPTTVPVGETSNMTHPALNGGFLPVYARYEPASSNVAVEPAWTQMSGGEQRNVTVTLQAPPRTGYFPQYVHEYRYFTVLPLSVVAALYSLHPWSPLLVTSILMGGLVLSFGILVVGTSTVRTWTRARDSWW